MQLLFTEELVLATLNTMYTPCCSNVNFRNIKRLKRGHDAALRFWIPYG